MYWPTNQRYSWAKPAKKEEWDNGGLHREIVVKVPERIIALFHFLDRKLSTEWMVFLKVDRIENNIIFLSEEFFIPEQEVQHSHVEAKEQPSREFNVVVHKHPRGIRTFSSTDYENINSNNAISLLWCSGEFTDATIQGTVLGIPVFFRNIRVEKSFAEVELDEETMKKFKKVEIKTYPYYSSRSVSTVSYAQEESYEKWIEPPYDDMLDEAVWQYLTANEFPDEVKLEDISQYVKEFTGRTYTEADIRRALELAGYNFEEEES